MWVPVGVTLSHPDDRGGAGPAGLAGPGVAAAGAQAASFPIHFGRHPTPERTADYASRTTLGGVFPERLRPLVEATADLSERFEAAGHSLYLVGGSVRDAIVSGPGTDEPGTERDLDFTTDARPDATAASGSDTMASRTEPPTR